MRNNPPELADEFFDKETVETVDFEIAFAAFLGTAVITYPVSEHILFGQIVAFSLLFLTLLRRMSITSPFAPEEKILNRTVPLITFVSASAILYLIVSLLPTLVDLIPLLPQIVLFSGATLIIFILLLVGQELFLWNYFPWWYVKFKQKSEQMDLLQNLWQDMAVIAYWASMARRDREGYRELGNRIRGSRPDLSNYDITPEKISRYALSASLLLGLLYLLPSFYSIYLFDVQGILVVPAVVAIHDHSAFLYIAHGNPSYEDLRQHILIILIRTGVYITEISYLLPN